MGKLELIGDAAEKRAAQRKLEASLKAALPSQGKKTIGFPGGHTAHILYSRGPGTLWYAPDAPRRSSRIPRFWNSFGIFDNSAHAQTIAVEANVPAGRNTGLVAGLFARDTSSGEILLLHSGRLGGGRSGISKTRFLAWANPNLVDVAIADGRYRSAIPIGPVEAPDLIDRIWRFVQTVARFKAEASGGRLDTPDFRRRVAAYKKYSREFSGRKRGQRRAEIDYVSFHGDVVDAAAVLRRKRLRAGEEIVSTNLIDLGVLIGAHLAELYEVKTSCDRQSLYAALGQLVTHSVGEPPGLKRFLIVPANQRLPADIQAAIKSLDIKVRTFLRHKHGSRHRIRLTL